MLTSIFHCLLTEQQQPDVEAEDMESDTPALARDLPPDDIQVTSSILTFLNAGLRLGMHKFWAELSALLLGTAK